MENAENQKQVSLVSHSPWKSLRDSHIPTAATTTVVLSQNHKKGASSLPSALRLLQAHSLLFSVLTDTDALSAEVRQQESGIG